MERGGREGEGTNVWTRELKVTTYIMLPSVKQSLALLFEVD